MPSIEATTELAAPVQSVFDTSLDLDVELVSGRRWHVRTLDDGRGSRTSGPIALGETVRWQMRLAGLVPVRHTSRIVELTAPTRFVDVMERGLFADFRHEHDLEAQPGGTRMHDRMTWRSPLGVLGRIADAVFVRRTLQALLEARNAEIGRRVAD